MNEIEFLIDTINHYTSLNRNSKGDTHCVYKPLNDKSKGCAVGRHLLGFEGINQDDDVSEFTTFVTLHPELIPDWMAKLNVYFANRIQRLHDDKDAWDNAGLSKIGADMVNKICCDFSINYDKLIVSCPRIKHHEINRL